MWPAGTNPLTFRSQEAYRPLSGQTEDGLGGHPRGQSRLRMSMPVFPYAIGSPRSAKALAAALLPGSGIAGVRPADTAYHMRGESVNLAAPPGGAAGLAHATRIWAGARRNQQPSPPRAATGRGGTSAPASGDLRSGRALHEDSAPERRIGTQQGDVPLNQMPSPGLSRPRLAEFKVTEATRGGLSVMQSHTVRSETRCDPS